MFDGILDLIDHAIHADHISVDAMRWAPEAPDTTFAVSDAQIPDLWAIQRWHHVIVDALRGGA